MRNGALVIPMGCSQSRICFASVIGRIRRLCGKFCLDRPNSCLPQLLNAVSVVTRHIIYHHSGEILAHHRMLSGRAPRSSLLVKLSNTMRLSGTDRSSPGQSSWDTRTQSGFSSKL